MAEASSSNANSKSGLLAKAQKHISRTKTKVLQNLGKAEKTTDDQFKDFVQKTERQQEVAQHLQKELKNYSHCVQNLCEASRSLQNALVETYEVEWTSAATFKSLVQAFDLLWNDYLQNLQDRVIAPMQTYLHSFPVLKTKVNKRGRKMVDFDNSKHNLEVLQAAKKKDEVKIQKAQEDLREAKRIFDDLNNELHTELPEFYNSRVTFYADLFSKLFNVEHKLHSEVGKTCESLTDITHTLGKDFEQYKYNPKRPVSSSISTNSGENGINGEMSVSSSPSATMRSSTNSGFTTPTREPMYNNEDHNAKAESSASRVNGKDKEENKARISGFKPSQQESEDSDGSLEQLPKHAGERYSQHAVERHSQHTVERHSQHTVDSKEITVYEEPVETKAASPTSNLSESSEEEEEEPASNDYTFVTRNTPASTVPANTLYTVQATHKYTGEDNDELNFEAGEIIYVIEFENPDEQDDGWQMGIKQSDGSKGVFPENFTRRIG